MADQMDDALREVTHLLNPFDFSSLRGMILIMEIAIKSSPLVLNRENRR
jgi:hypothetical protein